jgi:tetratricopeptide (TPR) repeat protein
MLRRTDTRAAEALFYEGTWLSEQGDHEGARMAFRHAMLLDRSFGGAAWNHAALTERLTGASQETLAAWREYLAAAANDPRQRRDTVAKAQAHAAELEAALAARR